MVKFRKPRHPSRLQVRVMRGGQEDRFTVLDVSETGMKLAGLMSLGRGEKVRVAVQSIDLTAEVVWASGGRAGVRFLSPVSPRTLATIRRVTGSGTREKPLSQPARSWRMMG